MTRTMPFSFRETILFVLFAAYLLMTVFVVQQAHIIANQKQLIHELFQDSLELNAMKVAQVQKTIHK